MANSSPKKQVGMKQTAPHDVQKVLVIGPSWVGDMVMAHTLFQILQQQQSRLIIDVLAPGWCSALLKRMPEVRDIIVMPIDHGELALKKRWALAKTLRQASYDQVIVLPNSFKSALIPFWARIPQRTGWAREGRSLLLNDTRRLNKSKLPLTVQRFVALALSPDSELPSMLPKPKLSYDEETVNTTLHTLNLTKPTQPLLILCPGAEFGPSKRWPCEYFAKVAQNKINEGWQVWVLGSPKEKELGEEITHLTQQQALNLIGKTNLSQAIDLLSLATAVISNDSGLMHVAAALDKPVIAIYGSTSPGHTPPLSANATTLSANVECSPCFKRTCPLHHHRCMQDLQPNSVLKTLDEMLFTG